MHPAHARFNPSMVPSRISPGGGGGMVRPQSLAPTRANANGMASPIPLYNINANDNANANANANHAIHHPSNNTMTALNNKKSRSVTPNANNSTERQSQPSPSSVSLPISKSCSNSKQSIFQNHVHAHSHAHAHSHSHSHARVAMTPKPLPEIPNLSHDTLQSPTSLPAPLPQSHPCDSHSHSHSITHSNSNTATATAPSPATDASADAAARDHGDAGHDEDASNANHKIDVLSDAPAAAPAPVSFSLASKSPEEILRYYIHRIQYMPHDANVSNESKRDNDISSYSYSYRYNDGNNNNEEQYDQDTALEICQGAAALCMMAQDKRVGVGSRAWKEMMDAKAGGGNGTSINGSPMITNGEGPEYGEYMYEGRYSYSYDHNYRHSGFNDNDIYNSFYNYRNLKRRIVSDVESADHAPPSPRTRRSLKRSRSRSLSRGRNNGPDRDHVQDPSQALKKQKRGPRGLMDRVHVRNACGPGRHRDRDRPSSFRYPHVDAPHGNHCHRDHPTRLSLPSDKDQVNSLHAYVRSDLLEIFLVPDPNQQHAVSTDADTDTDAGTDGNAAIDANGGGCKRKLSRSSRRRERNENHNASSKINTSNDTSGNSNSNSRKSTIATNTETSTRLFPGRIGLRCTSCAHIPRKNQHTMASFHPKSLSDLYRSVCCWQRVHFKQCTHVSEERRRKYDFLKESDKTRGKTRYWKESASLLGMVDVVGKNGKGGVAFRSVGV